MGPNRGGTGRQRPVQLALQGGGAHGALTWGVLDRLLEEPRLEVRAVSGTSAGAMSAVVLADGFARGGSEAAREALAAFWRGVSAAGLFSPMRRGLIDRILGRDGLDGSPGYLFLEGLARFVSPYDLNPLGLNPLRDLLRGVDFDRLNRPGAIAVHVTATDVRTGHPRTFSSGELSAEAVMASACLPQLYPAVEIDGEAYWDGGFTGNPALFPLLGYPEAGDVVVVQINPARRQSLPRRAREIINRVNEITFNASLLRELSAIELLQRRLAAEGLGRQARGIRLHLIQAGPEADELAASGKLDVEWSHLRALFECGRDRAEAWLGEAGPYLGLASTLDLEALFTTGAEATGGVAPRRAGWLQPVRRLVRRWS